MEIFVVVPTVREDVYAEFLKAWDKLFRKHQVTLITVRDGDTPDISITEMKHPAVVEFHFVTEEVEHLIYNKNDGVRNAGFFEVAKLARSPRSIVVTLDDDTRPDGDTIQDHIDALQMKVPTSWINTASEYMRGFPYKIRDESEVVLSHGVWKGVADWDAPTQLVKGNRPVDFYKGPIPKGIFYPMCGMNIAFKAKMLPYMYYAPMGPRVGLDRFADIWLGINSKKIIDKKGWAVVSGYSTVLHARASNVWKNLQKEAKGLELNETYWEGDESDPYFKEYNKARKEWKKLIKDVVNQRW